MGDDGMTTPWIQTAGGRAFSLLEPQPDDFDMEDIAHALAHLCRFNGHTLRFYSVAQHSVIVSRLVPQEHAVAGLLHDAAEAYLGDVTRPLKQQLAEYRVIEERVERALAERFGLPYPMHPAVKIADNTALAIERRDVMGPPPQPWNTDEVMEVAHYPAIEPYLPRNARLNFLLRARELGLYTFPPVHHSDPREGVPA